jgi:hypothetical protein
MVQPPHTCPYRRYTFYALYQATNIAPLPQLLGLNPNCSNCSFCLVQAKMSPFEVEGRSLQLQCNNRGDALARPAHSDFGRASIISGQRSRFATSAVSSLLSTTHQQMNSQSEPSSQSQFSIYSAGNDSRDVNDAVTANYKPTIHGLAVDIVHTHKRGGGRGQLAGLGPEEDQHKGRRKPQLTGRWQIV